MLQSLNTNKKICILVLIVIFQNNFCAVVTDVANIKTIKETDNYDVLNLNKSNYLNFSNMVHHTKIKTLEKRNKFKGYRRCRQRCQCRSCCRCESLLK